MTYIISGAALLLLAWLIGQHLKEMREAQEEEDRRNAPLNQFLKDWGESEEARNHII